MGLLVGELENMTSKENAKKDLHRIEDFRRKLEKIIPVEYYRQLWKIIEEKPPHAIQRFNESLIASLFMFMLVEYIAIQPIAPFLDPTQSPLGLIIIGAGFTTVAFGLINLTISIIQIPSDASYQVAFLWALPLIFFAGISQSAVLIMIPTARALQMSSLNLSLFLLGFLSLLSFEFGIANATVGIALLRLTKKRKRKSTSSI
jgi:hypothetical protein